MRAKDKKIIDKYIAKHGANVNPKKLEEYAKKKGIHVNVMDELEHRKLKKKLLNDLNLPANLDMQKEDNQSRVQAALDALSPDQRDKYLEQVNDKK